ncbi:MAG: M1 family metallopeptidase [Chitinophagales bacterium]|nr:M1 family metallopeptidase [Chitinophagales bacterium]MDW8417943.1 M1 family metallopeptidase [Chitinophagales bacterium]
MKYLRLAVYSALVLPLFGQSVKYNDQGPENNFRSPANPYYWKNKLPHPGYWQQDVHYRIKADIDETTDIITGTEELTYYNNSPDTLREVYFHLYQNAFQPGSYLDDLQRHNDVHPSYSKYEEARLGTVIDELRQHKSPVQTELDNTILRVKLHTPLAPNDSTRFFIRFRTFYGGGSTRRRMKKFKVDKFTHYNGCQWYPKICVYDRKSGWNTDQHLNREFYGDFGTFDVELTFASNYIVEATGVLQNEAEVLPDTLKKKLDLRNFKDTKWDTVPSVIIPYKKGERKTWVYHAENVHDFAFTADPTYRIHDTIIYPGRLNGDGVRCVAIAQEPHASGWQNAVEYLAKIIHVFSRDFGVYEYPKIVVADAQDGMEYPMLTLDGGRDKEYRGLLVHEVGHNWFYGMVGSNETYRAMLDEGFTQFLTAWGLEAIDGDTIPYDLNPKTGWYFRKFFEPTPTRDSRCYYGYLSDAIIANDEPLNTHSDGFHGALGQGGGYRHVYVKTATMLYNLQYVLGDSLFKAAMQHYVQQWKFAHPYPEDFRNSITHFVKTDLNWFFDQWMETTKSIDYSITRIRRGQFDDEYEITLRRKGRMQMPIDLRVVAKDGSVYDYHVPNTWFNKVAANHGNPGDGKLQTSKRHEVPPTLLPKWYGWDKLQPTYIARVRVPSGIRDVIIDPSERLADINMLDNRKRRNVEVRFDSHIYPFPSWKKYRLYLRPDIWWNAYDGMKLGLHINGNYMYVKHQFSLTCWVNTHILQGRKLYYFTQEMLRQAGYFSYNFSYQTAIDKFIRRGTFYLHSRWLDGYEMYRTGITKNFPQLNLFFDVHLKAFTRPREIWRHYLMYPDEWSTYWTTEKKFNTSLNVSFTYSYNKRRASGYLNLTTRGGFVTTAYHYNYFTLTHINRLTLGKLDLRTRAYGRYGTGSDIPTESALYFAGGNPEEMMESKYYRAAGFVPASMAYRYTDVIGHLHFGGGLNMRGYSGYWLPEKDENGFVIPAYRGPGGVSVNAELEFNRLVQVKSRKLREIFALQTYLFADAGAIYYRNTSLRYEWSALRADAGIGAALTIKKWGNLQNIKPLTLRVDFPFFITHAPYAAPRHVDLRWVVAVGRAF